MSSQPAPDRRPDERELREQVDDALREALPAAHARRASVRRADPATGAVMLSFGCGCSGGTLSPIARAALETRLIDEVTKLETVEFEAGCGCGGHAHRRGHHSGTETGPTNGENTPDAPF